MIRRDPLRTIYCSWCEHDVPIRVAQGHVRKCAKRPTGLPPSRLCMACDRVRLDKEFSSSGTYCSECLSSRAKTTYWKRSVEARHAMGMKKRYGLTSADYALLVDSQKGRCAICGCPPAGGITTKHLHVDHDHKNNKHRGLLCSNCNRSIGCLREDPALFDKAKEYLLRWKYLHQGDIGTP